MFFLSFIIVQSHPYELEVDYVLIFLSNIWGSVSERQSGLPSVRLHMCPKKEENSKFFLFLVQCPPLLKLPVVPGIFHSLTSSLFLNFYTCTYLKLSCSFKQLYPQLTCHLLKVLDFPVGHSMLLLPQLQHGYHWILIAFLWDFSPPSLKLMTCLRARTIYKLNFISPATYTVQSIE